MSWACVIDTLQNWVGIEDTEEEKAADAGRKMLEEMKKSNEVVAAKLDEGNTIARGRGHAAAGQAQNQTDAVNNQTREANFSGRKQYLRAGRPVSQ